jgi:hypothetical protein
VSAGIRYVVTVFTKFRHEVNVAAHEDPISLYANRGECVAADEQHGQDHLLVMDSTGCQFRVPESACQVTRA